MTLITLLTDFGNQDGFAGIMKGVIWRISPQVQIADLTHEISPQNVLQAALILAQAGPFFPSETIHVAVVDPGVGTARRALGISTGNQYFIGPDNGIFTAVLEFSKDRGYKTEIYHLDAPEFWLPQVSRSFHGRDIFAPVAAHLANGRSLSDMGTRVEDPIRIPIPRPQRIKNGWLGQIVAIDHFGNLISNLRKMHLINPLQLMVTVGQEKISGLVNSYGERPSGELIAMIDSSENLSISIVNGSAAERLKAKVGDPVGVIEASSTSNR